MGWFRLNRRFGAGFALAALALQLALAFGHSHPFAFAPNPAIHAATPASPGHAPPPIREPADDDVCAICVVVSLTAAARAAEPPSLPPRPVDFVLVRRVGAAEAVPRTQASSPFRSRAPPIV